MNNKIISRAKCILYLLGLLALTLTAQAASFDCAKAASKIEKPICGDDELSKLDEKLNIAYKTALKDEKNDEIYGNTKIDTADTITVLGYQKGDLGIDLAAVTALTYNVMSGTGDADNLIGVALVNNQMYGGAGNDLIHNDNGNDQLYGEDGHDILIATGGSDELYGGLGNDTLQGGDDSDYLEGNAGDDLLDGGAGSDVLNGGDGNDFLFGGGSLTNSISYQQLNDPNAPPFTGSVGLVDGQLGLIGVVGLTGIAGDASDILDGGAGDDHLYGGEGADALIGGTGNDFLTGQAGDDTLIGGDGNDLMQGDTTQGDLTFVGGNVTNNGQLYTLPEFHGNDYLDGGLGDDTLVGDGGSDTLSKILFRHGRNGVANDAERRIAA